MFAKQNVAANREKSKQSQPHFSKHSRVSQELDWIEKDLENTGKMKLLLKEGIWQVPASERPIGWESLGGREA